LMPAWVAAFAAMTDERVLMTKTYFNNPFTIPPTLPKSICPA
jgi:hypothetical protein